MLLPQESVRHNHGGFADKEHTPSTPTLPPLAAARRGEIWGLAQAKRWKSRQQNQGTTQDPSKRHCTGSSGFSRDHTILHKNSQASSPFLARLLCQNAVIKEKHGHKEHGCQRLANRVLSRRRQSFPIPRFPTSFQQVGRISQAMGNTWTGTSQSTPQPHISNVPTSTGSPPAPPLPSLPNAIKTGPRFPTWCWEHL